MYQIGDLVFYGTEGVCRVDEIGVVPSIDRERPYYTLSPLYRDGKVFTPVDTTVLMRPTITYQEAQDLIGEIPSMPLDTYEDQNPRMIGEHYQAILHTNDCSRFLQLIKTIYTKWQTAIQKGKKLSQADENYLKRAEDLLYGEFAVALQIAKQDVRSYINASVEGWSQIRP